MALVDAEKLAMLDSNVEDGYSSSNNERAVPATRAKQYGKGLLMITLVLAVLAGGVAVFQRPGSGPTKNAAISQSVELEPVGDKDLAGFTLRLKALTLGKAWPQICTIFSQVVLEDACKKVGPTCLAETIELAKYYQKEKDDQPLIQQLMVTETMQAGEKCGPNSLNVMSPMALAPAAEIPKESLAVFTGRLSAYTKGKSWPEICTIYSGVLAAKGCKLGPYCPPEEEKLTKYYEDNEKDRPAIQMLIHMDTTKAGVNCGGAAPSLI